MAILDSGCSPPPAAAAPAPAIRATSAYTVTAAAVLGNDSIVLGCNQQTNSSRFLYTILWNTINYGTQEQSAIKE
jgi:hypothetical protein